MRQQNPASIAHDSARSRSAPASGTPDGGARRLAGAAGLLALSAGVLAAWHYWGLGLTLSHYDARAHLVVARRILDSLTPGWNQIGAVWLPLPHLLNAIPVQVDLFYRTGASAVAISVVSLALTAWALSRFVLAATGSRAGAIVCTAALLFNPDVLYLSSTPMTEPLLLALSALALWMSAAALATPGAAVLRHFAGALLAAACLVRYEAWPVTGAMLGLGLVGRLRSGVPARDSLRQVATMAAYPTGAVLLFLVLSKATVGAWLVSSGFFVPETLTTGKVVRSFVAVWWGAHHLTGYPAAVLGTIGLLASMALGFKGSGAEPRRALLLGGALAAAAALPWYAFYAGHPFRFRYMAPLVPAAALGLGLLVGVSGRWRAIASSIALTALLLGPRPLAPDAPVIRESQLDRDSRDGRRAVTGYLASHWDGRPVLASMGALAHYMQDLSRIGFNIRDFVHEGNGDIWEAAVRSPARQVRWILVEEASEGGDLFAVKARADASYLAGFDRVAEGGNVALYRRAAPGRPARSESGSPPAR